MSKTVRIWLPDDQEKWGPLRAVARDGAPPHPQPGRVFVVQAATAKEARESVKIFLREEPDEERDPDGFLRWRKARRSVKELKGVKSRAELAEEVKRG